MAIHVNHTLDATGLSCPMPIVKTKKKIQELLPGEVLEVQATDRGSIADIKAWAESTGEQYLGTIEENNMIKHFIRKSREEETKEPMTFEHIADLEELKNNMDKPTVTILDVREPAEYAFGHIPKAVSIPLGEMNQRYDELNKNDEIYVICRTGNRSDYAAKILAEKGFKKVKNVVPGMIQWTGEIKKLDGGEEK